MFAFDLIRAYWLWISLFCTWFITNRYNNGLTDLPGPRLASYSRLWELYQVYLGHFHLKQIELHREYGPIVRIAPSVVSIADPAAISILYGTKDNFKKTAFYPIQSIVLGRKVHLNLFSEVDPAVHREKKKILSSSYSMSYILQLEHLIDRCTALFLSKLQDLAEEAKPIDLGAWLQYYAFDVIGEMTFSKKFGFLEQGTDVDSIINTIQVILSYSAFVGQVPDVHNLLLGNPLLTWLAPVMEKFNKVLVFTYKALNARTGITGEGEGPQGDMLARLQDIKANNSKFTEKDIVVTTTANVFAGSDTTSIALRSAVYYLCRNPEKKAIMLAELDAAEAAGKLSHPIKYKDSVTHLPYFCAVVKEAMRLHPSVGLILERYVPIGGVQLCGHFLPAGTIVGINPWVLNYDAANFARPESFEPERWLGDEDEPGRKERENMLMFNFGAGSRTCIGKNISMIELHKILPELFRRFHVELAEPEKPWTVMNRWFVQQEGLVCTLSLR